jgi:hypothetical protein
LLSSEATNVNGNVYFTGLVAGNYLVEFVAPEGYVFTLQDQGTNDLLDSDADPATGRTPCFYLAPGQQSKAWDAGVYQPVVTPPASLGNFVWLDTDKDGIQDGGEMGIPSVTVELYNCAGNSLMKSQLTAADGSYLFSDLAPGDYYVKFYAPDGLVFSPADQGSDDALDSDAGAMGQTVCTTLSPGETDLTWDAGLYKPDEPPPSNPGTGTPGYWKNHPKAWPVKSITIGGITYTKMQAITWMKTNNKQDKTITLFRALVAAKLNVLIGNESACIDATIASADAWMAAHPVGSRVRASSAAWKAAEPLYRKLDKYNNGLLCAPHRD